MKLVVRKSVEELIRYVLLSLVGYAFVFFFLYVFIDLAKINTSVSFLIVYGVWYLLLYTLQLRFLFKAEHSQQKFIKFCIYLVAFYILANLLFNLGLYLKINYLLSTLLTVTLLMPFRYIITKFYVFK
jgi:putative flippase GtrA